MRAHAHGVLTAALLLGAAPALSAQFVYRGPAAPFRDSQATAPLFELKPFVRLADSTTVQRPTPLQLSSLPGEPLSALRCPIRILVPDSTTKDRMPISRPDLALVERMPVARGTCRLQ
jgi:hypothetical protein